MKIPKKSPRDPNQLAKLIVNLSTADEPPAVEAKSPAKPPARKPTMQSGKSSGGGPRGRKK